MQDLPTMLNANLKFRAERNWEQFHKPKDVVISLMLEAAEVAEHFQWKSENELAEYIQNHRDEIGAELSDVLYWVLLLAHDLQIDLPQAFQRKMQENARKYPVEKAAGRHTKHTQL
jgi:NTP pyrophosphatase (non-canonical NTP hydrolase)